MQKKARKISRRAFFVIYFYLVVILFSVLTVSTYTWFSINRSPKVSNISLYVTAQSGLEFSKDLNGDDWSSQIMYSDLVKETPTLRPVTWSDREQRFYAARYGANGSYRAIGNRYLTILTQIKTIISDITASARFMRVPISTLTFRLLPRTR